MDAVDTWTVPGAARVGNGHLINGSYDHRYLFSPEEGCVDLLLSVSQTFPKRVISGEWLPTREQ